MAGPGQPELSGFCVPGEMQGQVGGSKTASIVADLSETTFETLYGEERWVQPCRCARVLSGSRGGGSVPPSAGLSLLLLLLAGWEERFTPWCGTPRASASRPSSEVRSCCLRDAVRFPPCFQPDPAPCRVSVFPLLPTFLLEPPWLWFSGAAPGIMEPFRFSGTKQSFEEHGDVGLGVLLPWAGRHPMLGPSSV